MLMPPLKESRLQCEIELFFIVMMFHVYAQMKRRWLKIQIIL